MTLGISKRTTVTDILDYVCNKRQLDPRDHYVRVKLTGSAEGAYLYPGKTDSIRKMVCTFIATRNLVITTDKRINRKILFLHQNIQYGYSLELPLPLMLSTLYKIFSRRHFEIMVLFFPGNRI